MDRAEVERVRAYLEGAVAELTARGRDGRRAEMIRALQRYIDAEAYPKNRHHAGRLPIFVDEDGTRCALAALLEATGHHAVVDRIARDHVYAYVDDLASDEELVQWLVDHDLTLAEAARIQPSYSNTVDSTWQPTAAIIGTIEAGASTSDGALLALSPGARLGARRVTASNGPCDDCVYQSMAFVAEYSRTIVLGVGATNQVALIVQYELNQQARDHQFYVMAGPVTSIDEAAKPGFGLGAKLGIGFSLRNRSLPILAELTLSSLAGSLGTTVRAGPTVGIVF